MSISKVDITDQMRRCQHRPGLQKPRNFWCAFPGCKERAHLPNDAGVWYCDPHLALAAPVVGKAVAAPVAPAAAAPEQICVFIPCLIPTTTSQQKGAYATKDGGVRFFKKAKTKKAAARIASFLRPYAPVRPFSGPLCLVMRLGFPWRKGESKARMKAFRQFPIDTRPDVENLFKLIGDQMTELGFWNDDSQISSLNISKVWTAKPGISLTLTHATALSADGETADGI